MITENAGYMSVYLKDLSRLPTSKELYTLVDLITDIDRRIFRKKWKAAYRKAKKAIELVESNLLDYEISGEILVSLYFLAEIALASVLYDTEHLTSEEKMSMDEFMVTVKEKFRDTSIVEESVDSLPYL